METLSITEAMSLAFPRLITSGWCDGCLVDLMLQAIMQVRSGLQLRSWCRLANLCACYDTNAALRERHYSSWTMLQVAGIARQMIRAPLHVTCINLLHGTMKLL